MRRLGVVVAAVLLLAGVLAACQAWGPDPNTQPPTAPLRLAFAYPWFPSAWNQQGLNPFTHYHPTDGFYSSSDLTEAQKQVSEMGAAGLQGAIESWWGQGTVTDQALQTQLDASRGTPFRQTVYYEPEGQGDPSSAQIGSDLSYLARYAQNPAWLRVDGKPAIFVYADANDGCGMADRWAAAPGRASWYVVLKVFAGYSSCAHQPDEWHQYGPASRTDQQGTHSFTISPGYWKANETAPRLARDLTAWKTAVQQMVASGAHLQLVTTFNEWGEGTAVEPATEWGTSYLDVLRDVLMGGSPSTTTTTPSTSTSTTTPSSTTTTVPVAGGFCGKPGPAPAHYASVVVFSFENRTLSDVGGTSFSSVPYFHTLAQQGCAVFSNYTEVDTSQNSATQYVGTWQGNENNTVRDDCSPSASCQSTAEDIATQLRGAGIPVHSFVEGATSGCSAAGNAAKHIPELYFTDDKTACASEVRPFSEFNPSSPPAGFSFITPTLCDDGHDCGNSTVSSWAANHIQAVLNSSAYQQGRVLVQVWYDEDHPVPNMFIAPTSHGVISTPVNYASTLRLWEETLGVPVSLGNAPSATDIRPLAGL